VFLPEDDSGDRPYSVYQCEPKRCERCRELVDECEMDDGLCLECIEELDEAPDEHD
jgi:hypothetical protein